MSDSVTPSDVIPPVMIDSDHYAAPMHGWTCFHCGETFTTPGAARDHFGADQLQDPACRIKAGEERGLVKALRRAEDELGRYRCEDSDADRAMAALCSDHAQAMIREEEKGYARGLRDARYEDDARRSAEEERDAACVDRDAMLEALGFKPGPLGSAGRRKMILEEAAGLRPAMIAARWHLRNSRDDADLWRRFVAEGYVSGLLARVWRQRRDIDRAHRRLLGCLSALAQGEASVAILAAKAADHLAETADFNRSWTDGRRRCDGLTPSPIYYARCIEVAEEREAWAGAIRALLAAVDAALVPPRHDAEHEGGPAS